MPPQRYDKIGPEEQEALSVILIDHMIDYG